ncbi:MAG: tetratricopeptide repeat protein [Paludibacter sp.]|nr:tetratricopeptide repeat protein [Paludibacter sp.]
MLKKLFIYIFLCFSVFAAAQLNTDRVMSIGQNALYFDDYVLAIQYFNQVITAKPYLYEPYMYRGIAKIQLGDFAGAEADCSQAILLNPFVPQAYYARGFARQRLEKHAEAEADFSKALEFNPENQNLIQNRMYARAQENDFDGAFEDLAALEKLNPKNNEWLYERGRLNFFKKDSIAAEENLLKYTAKDSTNAAIWSMLALLKIQTDDTAAIKYLDRAIALGSDFSGDYINRGILNVQRLKYMSALADYNEAIKIDGSPLAYYNRGLLRALLGDNNNAISDLDIVLKDDSLNYEARLRRAMVYQTLRQYNNALNDYNIILEKYPYFVPVYQQIAQIYDARGDARNAFLAREKAYNIEKNREKIKKQIANSQQNNQTNDSNDAEPATGNVLALSPAAVNKKRESFFSSSASQNTDNQKNNSENRYANDPLRGNVQDKYADIKLERNFELNYYARNEEIRRTPLYYIELDKFNKENTATGALKITNREMPLTEILIQTHFAQIEQLTKQIAARPTATLYFDRAINFALVKDFTSAIEDLNHALALNTNFMLAIFARANIRYKSLEISANQTFDTEDERKIAQKQRQYDTELILRDYDKLISIAPDFCFAYFNRANVLCSVRSFTDAVADYTLAIANEQDFAEAYFNRGIANLYLANEVQGLADLSKAGELGIFEAYNLIKRYKK